MRAYITLCLFTLFAFGGYGQDNKTVGVDTILFNGGKVFATHIIDTTGARITAEKLNSKKHKKIEIDRSDIFSIRYANTGKEVVFYFYDTLIGNDYTVEEARMFIAGEQDAMKGYYGTGPSIGAFVIGMGTGIIGPSFFSFAPPLAYAGIMAYPRIHIRHKSVSNINNVKSDPYLYGYDNVARKKRVIRSLLWGGVGLATGIIVHFALASQLGD